MAAKDLMDSKQTKNSKPGAGTDMGKQNTNAGQKTNKPCKNSLPT